MIKNTFQVDQRAQIKPKHLRAKGILPGNVFGKSGSVAVQMNTHAFRKLHQQAGETGLIYLEVAGSTKQHPVLIDEIQVDPVDAELIHVAFKEVDLTDKIEAKVPVEVIGKFEIPEATIVVVKDEIEVEALPTDLPEKFVVDITVLTAVGQMIAYKDLKFDRSKVTLVMGKEGENEPIVLVQQQRAEEVEEVPVVEPVEGAEGSVEGAVEGETPATEGEAGKESKPGDEKTVKPADGKPAAGKAAPADKKAGGQSEKKS